MQKYLIGTISATLIVTGSFFAANDADGAEKHGTKKSNEKVELKPQATCPIMGGNINKTLYVDTSGARIYVCCRGCLDAVKKDPEAALRKLHQTGQYAESLQKTCPVMGGKINKDLYVEHQGRRLYVCCPGCIEKVKANPELYAQKIAEEQAGKDQRHQHNHKTDKHEKH